MKEFGCTGIIVFTLIAAGFADQDPLLNFTVHTNDNPDGLLFFERLPPDLNQTFFNADNPTFFVISGWSITGKDRKTMLLKDSLLERMSCNVFIVNWSMIPIRNATSFSLHINYMGNRVADLIDSAWDDYLLFTNTIQVIGYSYGAQIASVLAHHFADDNKIDSLILLDPLPFFGNQTTSYSKLGIDGGFADYVIVVHTSILSAVIRDGDLHFYVNGGFQQPECNVADVPCCHSRGFEIFNEALRNGGFPARQCVNYDEYVNGKCNDNVLARLDLPDPDYRPTGAFFLRTAKDDASSINVSSGALILHLLLATACSVLV